MAKAFYLPMGDSFSFEFYATSPPSNQYSSESTQGRLHEAQNRSDVRHQSEQREQFYGAIEVLV